MLGSRRVLSVGIALTASGTAAQAELEISICEGRIGLFYITAELLNPEHDVLAVLGDLQYQITGQNITSFQYNDAYDSEFFGPASVSITPGTLEFSGGNVLPPLNNVDGPDTSNPIYLGTLTADSLDSIALVGQNTGAYQVQPGDTFPQILVYQHTNGAQGNTYYSIDVNWTCHASFCRGDINGDWAVTPADFTAWIDAFNNGSFACDQNFDGQCTATDFTAWLTFYNAGCD